VQDTMVVIMSNVLDVWIAPLVRTLKYLTRVYKKIVCFLTWGNAVAHWLGCCATNQKVAGSIPAGVIGLFH